MAREIVKCHALTPAPLNPRPYRWRGGDYDIETGERLAQRDDMEV